VLLDLLTPSRSTFHQQHHSQYVHGVLKTFVHRNFTYLPQAPSAISVRPLYQIPTTLPTITLQRLLAHPRRIEPTRLELNRRASILVVEPNHRLASVVAALAFDVESAVGTKRAAGRIVATTDGNGPPSPRDQKQRAQREVQVDHTSLWWLEAGVNPQSNRWMCCTHKLTIIGIVP
jgi:hypothetical protein